MWGHTLSLTLNSAPDPCALKSSISLENCSASVCDLETLGGGAPRMRREERNTSSFSSFLEEKQQSGWGVGREERSLQVKPLLFDF